MKILAKRTTTDECAVELLDVVPQVMRVMRAEMRSRRSGELSVPQFRTLAYLSRHPGSALLDVTAHIGLMPPTMSKLVDGLIARKLVSRNTSETDRRRVTLSLTAEGKVTLERARRHIRARLADALSTLPETDKSSVREALAVLRRAFSDGAETEKR
jgi:DNA-binding MarR family transcriptional regulator